MSLESKTCTMGETTSHVEWDVEDTCSPHQSLHSLPFPSTVSPQDPWAFSQRASGSALQGWSQCHYVVMWPGLGAVLQGCGFHGFQRHVDPSTDGAVSGWCVCSGLTVLPNVQHPPCPCPVTEPCSQGGGVGLCVGGLFLERKWSPGGTGCGCHC